MANTTHPTKEAVRKFMKSRAAAHTPPPAPIDIRTQLGWKLIDAQRSGKGSR
ncbi:MAG: hypothetical protein V4463_05290 [Pseudomonadota bacterium]